MQKSAEEATGKCSVKRSEPVIISFNMKDLFFKTCLEWSEPGISVFLYDALLATSVVK